MHALPRAANANELEQVRAVLASGDFSQHDLDLALARCVLRFNERRQIAQLLLEHGADPNGQYGSDYGPIVFVTGECLDPDGLQFLIDAGADVTFAPIATKYGNQCPLGYFLGSYVRGHNDKKHRGIDILLKHNAHVPHEVTPEVLAIHRGDAHTLGTLLDRNPSLLARCYPTMPYGNIPLVGATLLHCAVEFGELECVDLLLDRHADINMKADIIENLGGQTPVFHAIATCSNANFYTLEHLVQRVGNHIDMSIRASFKRSDGAAVPLVTPLEYAQHAALSTSPDWCRPSERELAFLDSLDRGARINIAILENDLSAVTQLLDAHPDLLSLNLWPAAIYQAKSLPITRLLLSRGLSPNACSAPRRPLHLAVYQCLPDIVDLLLVHGADPGQLNPLYERPLDLLDAYEPRPVNDPDTRRIRAALIQAGASDDIHSAIRAGDLDAVRHFLDLNPALLHSNSPWPPLFTAARSARVEVARLLITRGATIDATNDQKNTPLWFVCQSSAAASDRFAVAQLLLNDGANPNALCENGTTPLHLAAYRGPAAIVQLLLTHHADAAQKDAQHLTPLDHAQRSQASSDKQSILEILTRAS